MFKKGTVVLIPFPFTDLSGKKIRPGIIISKGKVGQDIIVVFVTSASKSRAKHTIVLSPTQTNGIKVPSQVVCSKIATLETKIVLGELGSLTHTQIHAIDSEVEKVLGLS
jgi:mRNA interferase MazF